MIKNYTLKALEKAINQALSLDETRLPRIRALSGKVLEMVITPLNVRFFIQFTDDALKLHGEYSDTIDTTICSSPLGLIRLSLLPASKVRSLFNDQITVTGDVELGQAVKKLFNDLDIDWEGHLAQFTGDVVAFQIGSFVRQGLDFNKRAKDSFKRNVTEYLQEELQIAPPREELNDFFQDLDELLLSVERLEAHMNQLLVMHENN